MMKSSQPSSRNSQGTLYHPTSSIDFQTILFDLLLVLYILWYISHVVSAGTDTRKPFLDMSAQCLHFYIDLSFDPLFSETTKCSLAENARLSDEIFEEAVVSLRCRCCERACCSIRLGSTATAAAAEGEEQFRAPLG